MSQQNRGVPPSNPTPNLQVIVSDRGNPSFDGQRAFGSIPSVAATESFHVPAVRLVASPQSANVRVDLNRPYVVGLFLFGPEHAELRDLLIGHMTRIDAATGDAAYLSMIGDPRKSGSQFRKLFGDVSHFAESPIARQWQDLLRDGGDADFVCGREQHTAMQMFALDDWAFPCLLLQTNPAFDNPAVITIDREFWETTRQRSAFIDLIDDTFGESQMFGRFAELGCSADRAAIDSKFDGLIADFDHKLVHRVGGLNPPKNGDTPRINRLNLVDAKERPDWVYTAEKLEEALGGTNRQIATLLKNGQIRRPFFDQNGQRYWPCADIDPKLKSLKESAKANRARGGR